MSFYKYGVCESCGRIVSTEETTMNSGQVDGKTYVKVSSKVCGCNSSNSRANILREK
jgi:hypothetical protein